MSPSPNPAADSSEQMYRDAIEGMALYNARLLADRRMRLPYLDNNTGVAQTNCHLWMKPEQREPGRTAHQVCAYPERRWKKRRRPLYHSAPAAPSVAEVAKLLGKEIDMSAVGSTADLIPIPALDSLALKGLMDTGGSDSLSAGALDDTSKLAVTLPEPTPPLTSKDKWYDDVDDISEPLDAGEIEDLSDYSDYDESYKKKKRKAASRSKAKSKSAAPAAAATISGGGLVAVLAAKEENEKFALDRTNAMSPMPKPHDGGTSRSHAEGKATTANDYCDFCLGDSSYNKKTRSSEGLVSCSDCGRSGHPTCLQFTENMKVSVKKYPWQCIECKSCGICGTSENDDQLLFCDDCDRGYHMYCLNPPLASPPEGNWSCQLCINEFHRGQKPQWMP